MLTGRVWTPVASLAGWASIRNGAMMWWLHHPRSRVRVAEPGYTFAAEDCRHALQSFTAPLPTVLPTATAKARGANRDPICLSTGHTRIWRACVAGLKLVLTSQALRATFQARHRWRGWRTCVAALNFTTPPAKGRCRAREFGRTPVTPLPRRLPRKHL